MAALQSMGKPPRAKYPPLDDLRIIKQADLGPLETFAEGASAVIFRAVVSNPERTLGLASEVVTALREGSAFAAKEAFRTSERSRASSLGVERERLTNVAKATSDGGAAVAVKLARSREGQIYEDVEAELRLLHAISKGQMEVAEREKVRQFKASERASRARAARLKKANGEATAGAGTGSNVSDADFDANEASFGAFGRDSNHLSGGHTSGDDEDYGDDYGDDYDDDEGEEGGGGGGGTSNQGLVGASAPGGGAAAAGASTRGAMLKEDRATAAKRRELCRGGSVNLVRYLGAGLYEDHRRFLVFECCATTLEALLDVAEKPPALTAGSSGGGGSRGGGGGGGHPHWASKLNPFAAPARPQIGMARALKLGFELSLALAFLHNEAMPGHCVLHRDLKPSNVGLTATGSVRLLDLGLARAVPLTDMAAYRATVVASHHTNSHNGQTQKASHQHPQRASSSSSSSSMDKSRLLPPYAMTGYTGSLRYMAPEVATNCPYDESVDVYSLALVLWEIASLERPYKGYNKAKFFDRVVRRQERPSLDKPEAADWPSAFRKILVNGWATDPRKRPSSLGVSEGLIQLMVEQRYRDSVASEQEKFEIPPLFATGANTSGASIFGRLSEYAIGSSTRRGSEFMTGES